MNELREEIRTIIDNLNNELEIVINSEYLLNIEKLLRCTQVPVLSKSEDDPYTEGDFKLIKEICAANLPLIEKVLATLISFLIKYEQNSKSCIISKNLVIEVIFTASQYSNKNAAWSNENYSTVATNILDLLLQENSVGATGIEILLRTENNQQKREFSGNSKALFNFDEVLKPLLQYLSSNFNKSNFKNNPGTEQFYLWLLYNISPSELSENLGYFLPGALFMLDNWEPRHKYTALSALLYILNSVSGSELRLHGRASVIFDAAKHHLYSRDNEQLRKAFPVAIKAAEILQVDTQQIGSCEFSKLDEVFFMLLGEMCYEQRTDLRKVFAASLPTAIEALGVRSLVCTSEFINVVENYASTFVGSEAEDTINVLKAIECFIKHCWCMYHTVTQQILSTVIKLVCDCSCPHTSSSLTPEVRTEILTRSKAIVDLSYKVAPGTCKLLFKGVYQLDIDEEIMKGIITVFDCIED